MNAHQANVGMPAKQGLVQILILVQEFATNGKTPLLLVRPDNFALVVLAEYLHRLASVVNPANQLVRLSLTLNAATMPALLFRDPD